MEKQKFALTLTIPVEISSESHASELLNKAERVLSSDDWDEGRYPFDKELFGLALKGMLEKVVRESVIDLMVQKYGERHVTAYESGIYNTAIYKAEEFMKESFKKVAVRLYGWEVSTQKLNKE
jgi:hypothetical protein